MSAASEVAGRLGSPVSTAPKSGEAVFYRALGSVELATNFNYSRMGDKLDELQVKLGLRTSADVYASS